MRTGFFLDFDGTLSRVVPEPAAAKPLPGVPELLEALTSSYRLVAIVSGRRATDLLERIGVRGPRLVGLHGAEEIVRGELRQPAEAAAWRAAARRLAEEASELIVDEGLVGCEVEPKDLAVSVHYRKAVPPEPPEELLEWARSKASLFGFHFGIGRMVLEFRPAPISKAGTLERLMREFRLANAVLAGDDTADVEAMARAKEVVPGHLLRIGMRSREEPPDLLEHSDVQAESGEQLVKLLQTFL